MKPRSLGATFLVCATMLSTGACGGGGSSAPPPPTPTPTPTCASAFSAPSSFTRAGAVGLHWPVSQAESIAGGRFAVRFLGAQISPQAASVLAKLGARQTGGLNQQGAVTFSLPQSSDPRAAAAAMRGVPGVVATAPVIFRQELQVYPNDPFFDSVHQWDMYMTQMPNAWSITEGLAPPTVKIAVIDTGYDTANPDLAGKVDASVVYDLGNGNPDTTAPIEDKDGHGSDVSGIAAADTNNAIDIAGVGWGIHLLEARVFPYGCNPGASTQDIAAAVNWAVSNGAKVINLSLGSGSPDPVFEEPAVESAISAGAIVVAAAGNEGANIIDYPAAYSGVIAVGASAYHDVAKNTVAGGFEYVASYSNYGSGLALVAPGADPSAAQKACTTSSCIDYLQWILNLDSTQGPFREQLGLFAGTSQATPHVAGAVALMAYQDQAAHSTTLSPARALAVLKSSAHNISDPHQGAGRLDVSNALSQLP